MNKEQLINIFKKNISNGDGMALHSDCGYGYVYECNTENDCIRVGFNKILWKKNNNGFPFFKTEYNLNVDEFSELSKDLPKRLKRIKIIEKYENCTVRLRGSIRIDNLKLKQ